MNPAHTYSDYLERYGEVEGKILFLDLCEEMGWDKMITEILDKDWEKLRGEELDKPFKGWDKNDTK